MPALLAGLGIADLPGISSSARRWRPATFEIILKDWKQTEGLGAPGDPARAAPRPAPRSRCWRIFWRSIWGRSGESKPSPDEPTGRAYAPPDEPAASASHDGRTFAVLESGFGSIEGDKKLPDERPAVTSNWTIPWWPGAA